MGFLVTGLLLLQQRGVFDSQRLQRGLSIKRLLLLWELNYFLHLFLKFLNFVGVF